MEAEKCNTNYNPKKAGVSILISDKIDHGTSNNISEKDKCCIMRKLAILKELISLCMHLTDI